MLALFLAGGAWWLNGSEATSAAGNRYTAYVGNGARGISVSQFMPSALVITEGDTINWTKPYAEPHTVSFNAGKPTPADTMAPLGHKTPKFDGPRIPLLERDRLVPGRPLDVLRGFAPRRHLSLPVRTGNGGDRRPRALHRHGPVFRHPGRNRDRSRRPSVVRILGRSTSRRLRSPRRPPPHDRRTGPTADERHVRRPGLPDHVHHQRPDGSHAERADCLAGIRSIVRARTRCSRPSR